MSFWRKASPAAPAPDRGRGQTASTRQDAGAAPAAETSAACKSVIARAGELSPHAALAGKLLQTLQDDRSGPDQVRRELSLDQGLTAIVLRAANSAFYRRAAGEVRDVTEAIVVLGFDALRQLAIARLAKGAMRRQDEVAQGVWRHALTTALAAQACARAAGGITVGHAFTCGLLHDVGKAPLYEAFGPRYGALLGRAAADDSDIDLVERQEFGTDHAEVGAALLETWKLPLAYIHVARHHHHPSAAAGLGDKDRRLLAMVILSSDLSATLLRGGKALDLEGHPMLEALGTTPTTVGTMAEHAAKELAALERVLS